MKIIAEVFLDSFSFGWRLDNDEIFHNVLYYTKSLHNHNQRRFLAVVEAINYSGNRYLLLDSIDYWLD